MVYTGDDIFLVKDSMPLLLHSINSNVVALKYLFYLSLFFSNIFLGDSVKNLSRKEEK